MAARDTPLQRSRNKDQELTMIVTFQTRIVEDQYLEIVHGCLSFVGPKALKRLHILVLHEITQWLELNFSMGDEVAVEEDESNKFCYLMFRDRGAVAI